jgi:hypothetical protein
MANIEFHSIAARGGSQSNAFEELCCQLARRTCAVGSMFERYNGAGGDGGVECLSRLADGTSTGWQAKFVFDVEHLIAHANVSLETALVVHKKLTKYIVCFPFDPTGKTKRQTKKGRSAKSQTDKLNAWIKMAKAKAKAAGRKLEIERWPASEIQSLLFRHDSSGGIRHYFFDETILSPDWFKNHLVAASKAAGPRYTTELNVETDLWSWFSSFGNSNHWREALAHEVEESRQAVKGLRRQVKPKGNPMSPAWPASEMRAGEAALQECNDAVGRAEHLLKDPSEGGLKLLLTGLDRLKTSLGKLESKLASQLDVEHGEGSADSKRFRTFMAEYQVCFPAANLDAVRETATRFSEFAAWLKSPTGFLAFQKAFVLSGSGGSGKTHGICDMARKRLESGAFTCVTFGHQFSGQPAEWTRLVETLDLPATLGKDRVLDSLNAAGEASGTSLILCIDAVNETRPRDYWFQRFLPFAHEFEKRPFLKLCVSCRTSFLSVSLPQSHPYHVVEHRGFVGMERKACDAFFNHYNLESPLVPVMQPELSNPLYLKLVCETLQLKGLKRLPAGWFGLTPVVDAFLGEKEKQFAVDHNVSPGANIVAGSLLVLAGAIAKSGDAALPWSEAHRVVNEKRPQGATLPVLEWLVKADLLIEDGPVSGGLGGETVLRPAFERFGDFLVAAELLPKTTLDGIAAEFSSNQNIQKLLATSSSVEANAGIVQALSILLPEAAGVELPNLVRNLSIRETVLSLTMRALPWRTPDSFSSSTRKLARQALSKNAWQAMDSLLAVSAYASEIDAYWTSDLLSSLPMRKRDRFWCGYLHKQFEDGGIVKRLIEASADIELRKLDADTAARWSLILLWFSAAADRRVKDCATRAAIAIFRARPEVILPQVKRLVSLDDDEIVERVLLSAYGALIANPHKKVLQSLAETLLTMFGSSPAAFQNAIVRDHIRSIGELARQLGCLGAQFDPLITTKQQKPSDWPLTFPAKEQLDQWGKHRGASYYAIHSCLYDDFNHYSIGCLHDWMHQMDRPSIGGWIAKHAIEELGLQGESFDQYDEYMVSRGGGGRSKPVWAERIGKKYQWIGLYRLASRLHDNVDRQKRSSFDPELRRTPLILEEERKLDPTLSHTVTAERKELECWWLRGKVDLPATKNLDFATWIAKRDDLPSLEGLLEPTLHAGQRWTVLTAFPKWSEYRPKMEHNTPYRDAWMHLRGYLVPKSRFSKTIKALDGRNYFNGWLPEGGKWLHAFAGEYPWATTYNTEPDWYLGANPKVRDSDLILIHASNQVVIEWEYDATLHSSVYLQVPTKKFFRDGDLWWNGTDGFATAKGKTVFFDPQFRFGRPVTLLADFDDLIVRLDKIGYRLVWTLLGEKWVLGDERRDAPRIIYSQLAWLTNPGEVKVGERHFFENYNENQGLAKAH